MCSRLLTKTYNYNNYNNYNDDKYYTNRIIFDRDSSWAPTYNNIILCVSQRVNDIELIIYIFLRILPNNLRLKAHSSFSCNDIIIYIVHITKRKIMTFPRRNCKHYYHRQSLVNFVDRHLSYLL